MKHGFSALFSRMNYIDRWGLMRNSRKESLSEHAAATASIAHVLALLAAEKFGADVRPQRVAVAALYHDLSETLTGDMPTPVKYRDSSISTSYKKLEAQAQQQISEMLPDELQTKMLGYLDGSCLNEREHQILKAADKLSALVKCIEEQRSGNTEFTSAKQSTEEALSKFDLPELKYFCENFLPAYGMTLDELMQEN